jgi:dipeptidyl aminopeptidase/acylaminoacyl peptidase
VIDSEGGVPRRLTTDPTDEYAPGWSRDGRWVYFSSNRSGEAEIWRIPSEGGSPVQVTRHGGVASQASWNGRDLYYAKSDAPGVWRMPVEGGDETRVLGEQINAMDWSVAQSGLYYAINKETVRWRRKEFVIHFLDFESGQVSKVFRREGPFDQVTLTVSPDEEWILYGERPAPTSELMLVENFR